MTSNHRWIKYHVVHLVGSQSIDKLIK